MGMTGGEGAGSVEAGAAELAYQVLDEVTKIHVRRILLQMVCLDDALRPQWRSVPESVLGNTDPAREAALTALGQAGIITVRCQDDGQEQCVSIGSEALLETWPRLRDWVAGSRAELLARQQVVAAGAAWHARGRHDADLWGASRMAIASCLADGGGDVELPDQLSREFLAASMERGRRAGSRVLRHRQAVIAGACALLLVVVGAIWLANGSEGGAAQNAARSQQLISDAEALWGSPALAEQLALAAYRYSPSQSATDLLYKLFSQPSGSPMANAGGDILRISAARAAPLVAASSNDGSIYNGSFRIWKLGGEAPVLEATMRDVPSGALALSPDGTVLAAACRPRSLCLWDVAKARHPRVEGILISPKSPEYLTPVTSIAFSSDGTLVAAAGENGKTYVWSVQHLAEPRLVTVLPNPMTFDDPLAGVAFSARGDLLAETIQGGKTRLWGLRDPSRPVLVATISTGFQATAFSPDGSMLAAAGDTRVGLWNLADPARPKPIDIEHACTTGSSGSVLDLHAIAFSPGGDQIAYSGQDTTDSQATLCVLSLSPANLSLGSLTAVSTPTNFSMSSLAYTSTGELLTGGDDGLIRRWSAPLQQIDGLVPAGDGSTFDVSADGRLLAGVLAGPLYEPADVGVWGLSPGGPVAEATIPVDAENVAFLSRRLLLTATATGQIRLWDLTDPHSPREGASLGSAVIPTTRGWSYSGEVTANAAGTMVAVLGPDDTLHLWRVTSAYDVRQLSSIPADGARQGPAGILPDGRTALLETSKGIQWWGIADPARPVRGSFTVLAGVNVGEGAGAAGAGSLMMIGSPPGNGSDATIGLVDVDNGKVKSSVTLTKSAYYASGFSYDGSLLATTGDDGRSLTLWSTRSPAHPRRLAVRSVPQTQNVVFNAPGTTMAVVGKHSVQVWSLRDPGSPVLEGTFTPPAGPVGMQDLFEEEFAASGALFVEEFGTVYVVGGDSGDLAERLCASLGSAITAAQWKQYAPGVPYLNPCPVSGG